MIIARSTNRREESLYIGGAAVRGFDERHVADIEVDLQAASRDGALWVVTPRTRRSSLLRVRRKARKMMSRQASIARVNRHRLCDVFRRMGSAVELASDEAVGWRSLGALFLTGGFLAVAAIPLATTGGYRAVAVCVIGLIAIITGVVLCWRGASLPARPMSPMLGFGTLLITLVVIASGQPDGRYSLFYVWVALQAFYFLESRAATLHMLSVAAQYALALILLQGGADQWLLVLGTVVTTGWLVGALRTRIERLSTQARTDVLTGLANRRGFDEDIELALESARHSNQLLSLVAIDLDRFKAVNDRHGHLAGDAVLQRFAQLCAETVDLAVARLGGDEFALIAAGRDQYAATELAHRIHQAVRDDPELTQTNVTISIGIATFPTHADSSRSLSRAADRALYQAKDLGSDQIVAYGPAVEQSRSEDTSKRPERSSDVAPLVMLSEELDRRDMSPSSHSQTVARLAASPELAAQDELWRNRGTWIDETVVDALMRALDVVDDPPPTSRRDSGLYLTHVVDG
jgi:diguanylate cyclase (GGDEF)-like protein